MTRSPLSPDSSTGARYLAPGAVTARVVKPVVAWLTRRGLGLWGSRVLAVRGRTSGEVRTTPANVLELDGERYLVSPRGRTQWVRNLRAAGEGELLLGRHREAFTAVELADAEKPAVLRPYLRRWAFEVGAFFEGVGAGASDAELLAAAPRHPVFRLSPR